MNRAVPAIPAYNVRDLPPNIFAMVMATGIVSVAVNAAGFRLLAYGLFWLNVGLYTILCFLVLTRLVHYPANLAADLRSHARAPGFFTLVAGPCVLGNQCVLLYGVGRAGLALWVVGVIFWLALTYMMLPGLMEGSAKPKPEEGLTGAWLLAVVGTQAVSVLACLLSPALDEGARRIASFRGPGVLAGRQHVVRLADRADLPPHPVSAAYRPEI